MKLNYLTIYRTIKLHRDGTKTYHYYVDKEFAKQCKDDLDITPIKLIISQKEEN